MTLRPQQYPQHWTDFHARHGTETISFFLPVDEETSCLVRPSSTSLLSGVILQLENYSCILHVVGQVRVSEKKEKHQN